MTLDDYKKVCAGLHEEALKIQSSKRSGYTIGSADILANFKRVADRTGLSVGQVWTVYFLKHIDAITTIMCKPDLPVSEAPLGRFADALNYLDLGWAILQEAANEQPNAPSDAFYGRGPCAPTRLTEEAVARGL